MPDPSGLQTGLAPLRLRGKNPQLIQAAVGTSVSGGAGRIVGIPRVRGLPEKVNDGS